MHIRIIHQYFKSPETGGGMRTYYLGKELVSRGYQVSVITATNREKASSYELDGMHIHALPVYYSNHLGFVSRVSAFLRFIWQACHTLGRLSPADLNYVLTTPLTTGIIALYGKYILKQPYFFEVGDLWPDAPIALGILRNPFLIALSRWLEKTSYRNATGLIGLSPPISAHLHACAPEVPVETITNFSPEAYYNIPDSPEVRERYGIGSDEFVISYTGTLGMANHLEYLIDAIGALPDSVPISCIIMGDGARTQQLKDYAKGKKIIFLEHGDQRAVAEVLGISNAVYVSFANIPVLWTGSPNKFFDGLAAGKLIILNFSGWIKEIVEENTLGFHYRPDNPEEFVEGIRKYTGEPGALASVKERGRELAKKKYSPAVQVNILENFLRKTLG